MSQLLNLMLAYLLRCFGIGRHSASSMNAKIVSFFMVTIGLFLHARRRAAQGGCRAAVEYALSPRRSPTPTLRMR